MADKVKRLVEIAVSADTKDAERGLGGVSKAIGGIKLSHAAMAAAVVAGTVAVVKAFEETARAAYRLAEETSRIGDSFDKLSLRTGLAVDSLSEWAYVMERQGGDIGTLERGLQGMVRSMRDVQEGLVTAERAWVDLGVSVIDTDGSLRDIDSVLFEARRAISEMKNETEAQALAMEIFGRAGKQMIPVLRLTDEEFKNQIGTVRELGGVYGEEFTRNSANFIDAQLNLETATNGVKIALSETFTPALVDIINASAEAMASFGQTVNIHNDDFRDMADTISDAVVEMLRYTEAAIAIVPVLTNLGQVALSLKSLDLGDAKKQMEDLVRASSNLQAVLLGLDNLLGFDTGRRSSSGGGASGGRPGYQAPPPEAGAAPGSMRDMGIVGWESITARPPEDAASAADLLVDIPTTMAEEVARITDEQVEKWEQWQSAIEDMSRAVVRLGEDMSYIGAEGVTTFLGLREGAFRMGDAIRNVVLSALEEIIAKLIMIKVINPFLGFLGFKDGGQIGMAAGGMIPKAAAGMIVPDVGQRGLDSVPILAMPGEGVIKRDTMQRLDAFLTAYSNAAPVSPDAMQGSGGAAKVEVNYNISRPVSYRDHLDLGENAIRATRDAARRVV